MLTKINADVVREPKLRLIPLDGSAFNAWRLEGEHPKGERFGIVDKTGLSRRGGDLSLPNLSEPELLRRIRGE